MKALQKQSILEMLGTIFDLHKQLLIIKKENIEELLCMCQERAITIGNKIEESEENESITISLLEDYCEKIYQLSLINYTANELNQFILDIDYQIERIKDRIENYISDELYEVVFMPYNATMWDSMESVYKEAIKDDRCSVSVIPIPYFNINKNKDTLDAKYEGDRFPEYLKITDYKKYNMKEMRPDIIFIHNPYDEYNHVTRVSQEFYSSELIKYTDHLVYIPYYISESFTIEELCAMPGVRNAWRVFVQSEEIRMQYLKWNDPSKIVATGSPKIDCLLDMNSRQNCIKEEWMEVIKGRTVFLYNTHLNNIINESKELIKKIKYVISIFRDRDDIALIWRPHPLSVETAKSFSEEILYDYLEIIVEFKSLNNTIYDDTPDLYHSIGLSDAYIGDSSSSVVKLYGITGKPILFLNEIHLLKVHPKKCIRTISPALIDDNIYMFSWEYNALYCYNMKTENINYITNFSQEDSMKQYLYSETIVYGTKIYYSPCSEKSMAVYDTGTGNVEYVLLEKEGYNNYNIIRIDWHIFILPIYYSSKVFILDVRSNTITTIPTSYDSTISNFKNFGLIPLFYGDIIVGDKIWRVCRIGTFLQTYDYNNNIFDYYEVNCNAKSFGDITFDGTDFWILPNGNDNILRWNSQSKTVTEINIFTEIEKADENILYHKICYINGGVWLIPCFADVIIRIDVENLEIIKISYENIAGFSKDYDSAQTFNDYVIHDNNLLLFPYKSNAIVSIDVETYTVEALPTQIKFDNNEIEWVNNITHGDGTKEDKFYNCSHTYEERVCSLSQFIQIVTGSSDTYNEQRVKYYSQNIINADGSCGEKIWEYITEELKSL
ncbi:MAG TPA: hypothetical protein VN258_02790 [Mobilitalea sp.]|nr:hypothetical protein [Mobilitalea sp.]